MNVNNKDWKKLLSKLDSHQAPDMFNMDALDKDQDQDWTTLLNKLPEEKAPEIELQIQKEAKISSMVISTRSWLKIAASLLILVSVWMFWPDKNEETSIVFTKQAGVQNPLNVTNTEAAWSLEEFCAAYEIKCDQQELGQFREEWKEVSTAILSVLESLENNQNDEFLLRQLSTLEARHAELVNELLKIVWS